MLLPLALPRSLEAHPFPGLGSSPKAKLHELRAGIEAGRGNGIELWESGMGQSSGNQ